MEIRDAVEQDIQRVTEIYNEVLTTSTAIYSDQPAKLEERIAWWKSRLQQGYPVLVAVDEGAIIGFATFGDFRAWPGYRFTVEGTIHIHSSSRSRGVGTALLEKLIECARVAGKHSLMAGVDSENVASLQFLKRHGFEQVGYLPEVGFKFNRFLDLVFLLYRLVPSAISTNDDS